MGKLLKLTPIAAATLMAMSTNANAEVLGGSVSANVAFTTDYYFRGISQTDNDGALQGGFDWAHDSGLYAGVWASNVAFADGEGDNVNMEIDTYLGFGGEFGDTGIGYDLNVNRFNYNDSPDYETNEFTFGLSYGMFSGSYSYSDDWYDTDEDSHYLNLGLDYDLGEGYALSASVGKSFGDAFDKDVSGTKDFDYIDYSIGVSKGFYGLDWTLAYVGNNLSDSECSAYAYDAQSGNCDDRFILTVSKALDDVTSDTSETELPFTANVALVSDYYFRGISQTDNDGALQGGVDYAHDSGLYAGVWMSNVAFADDEGDNVNMEIDTYAGFGGEFGDTGIGYDLNVNRFNYNDSPDYETTEYTVGLSYANFGASYSYSSDWYNTDENSHYVNLGADFDLPYDSGLSVSVGKSFGDAFDKDVSGTKDFDYIDYSVGVSKEIIGLDMGLSYVGNNLSDSECDAYAYDSNAGNCDDRFIFSVSKGF